MHRRSPVDPVPGDPTTPEPDPLDPNNLIVPGTDNVALTLDLNDYYDDPNGDPLSYTVDMTGGTCLADV